MSLSRFYSDRTLTFDDLASNDPAMNAALERAKIAASRDIEVLISGETGTGKNMVALAMHNESPRKGGPFVALNAAAIPENLAESELFGHEKGSFTGATAERHGAFEVAHGGTLFLDEIANMKSEVQQKILTAVEHHRITRVGGTTPIEVNVRLISATNADLPGELDGAAFRRDLYYRMARIPISLPPLRERRSDLLPYARRFLAVANEFWGRQSQGFTPECEERILNYPWPGNVREMLSRISFAVGMCRQAFLDSTDLFHDITFQAVRDGASAQMSDGPAPVEADFTLATAERCHLQKVLNLSGWNVKRAAEMLKISREGLYGKMKRFGLSADGSSAIGRASQGMQ